jgi:hypothetical protein
MTILGLSTSLPSFCTLAGCHPHFSRLTLPKPLIRSVAFLVGVALPSIGFSGHWCDWISYLLSTASTRILLNSRSGQCICHSRGLRQCDPLSPFLFVLTMEVLNALFRLANTRRLVTPFQTWVIHYQVFLYADDLVIFLTPASQDIRAVRAVLELFVGGINALHKCQQMPTYSDHMFK